MMFDYKNAMPTPWGKADQKDKVAEGVYFVGTPSHGGVLIGRKRAEKLLSKSAIALGVVFNNYLAYEEDCLASVVMFELPELFIGLYSKHDVNSLKESCKKSIERWNPEYFANL